jgi:hypothetical protein
MQASLAGYALTYLIILKQQLVNWTVIGLTASCTSYAWALLARYHVRLDLHGLGGLLPVSCII